MTTLAITRRPIVLATSASAAMLTTILGNITDITGRMDRYGYEAGLAADHAAANSIEALFSENYYRKGFVSGSAPAALSGWAFGRTGAGTALTTGGALVNFATGVPRITDRGLLVEEARTNLLLRSAEFDNAAWTKSSCTVTANAIAAPDGTMTADKVVPSVGAATGAGSLFQSATKPAVAAAYTATFFVKAAGYPEVSVFCRDGASGSNSANVTVNPNTGAITSAAAATGTFTGASATVTALADGWYRIALMFTSGTETSLRAYAILRGMTGDGTSGVYLWGGQTEAGAFPSSYIPTTSATATRAADDATIAVSEIRAGTLLVHADVPHATVAAPPGFLSLFPTSGSASWLGLTAGVGGAPMTVNRNAQNVVGAALATANSATATGQRTAAVAFGHGGTTKVVLNGGAVASAADQTNPYAGLTVMRVGRFGGNPGYAHAYIRRAVYLPDRLSDADLQLITA